MTATAQVSGLQSGESTDAAVTHEGTSDELRGLIEVLRDDRAREKLISELERLEKDGTKAASPAPDVQDTEELDAPMPSLGLRVAQASQKFAEAAGWQVNKFLAGLRATMRRLSKLSDISASEASIILRELAIVSLITLSLHIGFRRYLRRVHAALGDIGRRPGFASTTISLLGSFALDIATIVIPWAIAYAIMLFVVGSPKEIGIYGSLFLNAFLTVEFVKAVLRAIFASVPGRLRLLPMGGRTARYWEVNLMVLATILGYGMLLLVPVVESAVSFFTARAVTVLIYTIVLLWAVIIVIRSRRQLPEFLKAQAEEADSDITIALLARISPLWHWAMIGYCIFLFVTVVDSSGAIGGILLASSKVFLAIALGAAVATGLSRVAARGVRLPRALTDRLPLIETRLNFFVPVFLGLVRFIILLTVAGYILTVIGVGDAGAWVSNALGIDLASSVLAVLAILVGAFVVWLMLSSWVEYRLNPSGGRRVTARERTLLTLMRNALTVLIIALALMFSLSELGVDIAPLIASAGVVGLAIGFGAQKLVQDIITGIFIQFENAINVGDYVSLGGVDGTVEKLTVRSVSLRDPNGTFHIVPFSSVDLVSNYMRNFAYHVADIGIAYREDIDEAKTLMFAAFDDMKAMEGIEAELMGPLEWMGVQNLADSAVVLRARMKTRPGSQWMVRRAYNECVKRRFDAAGIEIPFPQQTVWFGEAKRGAAPAAHIRIEREEATAPPSSEPEKN